MREMKPEQEDSREIKDELQLPEEEKPGFWGDSLADSGETDTDEMCIRDRHYTKCLHAA